jgi:peptidoglycan-N-acetylglucosamine deacetylase
MKKVVYFTIDDSPSVDFRKKIDYLFEKGIPTILFSRGDFLEKMENDVIYAIKNGFVIANHSYNHCKFSKITIEEAYNQIKKTDFIIEEIYKKSGIKRPAKLFRFPYGDKGNSENAPKIQEILKSFGYRPISFKGIKYSWFNDTNLKTDIDIYWTFDIQEWCLKGNYPLPIKSIKDVYNRLEQKDNDSEGSLLYNDSSEIVLIHDQVETTKYFFDIIDKLVLMNLEFKMPEF